jgi:hypothetical protein
MKRFLQETWELFYWALWCPSRLQQRMNEWVPDTDRNGARPSTSFQDILLVKLHLRFLSQFFAIIFCLSLPLALALSYRQSLLYWLLEPLVWLIAYGIAIWYLPVAFSIPLLVWWIYSTQPALWLKGGSEALRLLPPLPTLISGVGIGAVSLGITAITTILLRKRHVRLHRMVLLLGSTLSSGLGTWIASQDLLSTIFVMGASAFISFTIFDQLDSSYDVFEKSNIVMVAVGVLVSVVVAGSMAINVIGDLSIYTAGSIAVYIARIIAVGVAGGVAGGVAVIVARVVGSIVMLIVAILLASLTGHLVGGFEIMIGVMVGALVGLVVAIGVAVGVAVIVVGVPQLPLSLFLLAAALLAASFSPLKRSFGGIWLAIVLVVLGFEHFSWTVGQVILVVLVCYYRILPDYAILLLQPLPTGLPFLGRFSFLHPLLRLHRLPPHSSELLWLPVPGHAQLLTNAFFRSPSATLPTLQQMQASSLPGLQYTLRQALPQIIAHQLIDVYSAPDLQNVASLEHPILPLLVPTFYQPESTAQPSSTIASEVGIVLPKFQEIAEDMGGTLEASNAALRERGLERILNKLTILQTQMPGLGLTAAAIQRWQPAIIRWQSVIQLELEEQKKQSQGELLNPFQFGNPLRQERSHLFKGRRAFSDRVYRLVLDRNRPTLVLHGPRRCGKSSFLLNLSRLLPSDLVPVYIDMQRAGISNSEADFCYGLANAIYRDSRSQGIVLPTLPKRAEFYQNPYPFLEDWLDEALPELGDRRLLLNLDEFEKIGGAIQERRLSLRLFDELRSLIQHTDQLGFLFSGVQTLDELGPNWSSYFISVVPMEMLYLEQNEAEELLLDPDPEFTLRYDSDIVLEILCLTRCQPYLLQLIGSALVTQANLKHTQLVTRLMLEAAIQDAFTLGEPYFTNVWTEFTGTTPTEIAAGQAYLLSLAGRTLTPPDPSLPETQAAIHRLRRYHVIEQTDGSDRIEIPLFEQWVRERAIAA